MTPSTMTFPKMKRDRVFEQVSNEIKKQISSGILKPGDKLPSESELARNFNVSRQTIREAMRILELSGFLSIKRGGKGGPIIENTISSRVSKALAEAIQMGPATFDDFVLAWREIEKAILIQVVKNADEGDLHAMSENILNAKKELKNRIPLFRSIRQFHLNLAKASKNHIFELLIESIMAVYAEFLSRLEPDPKRAKKIITIHENLLKAIERKEENRVIFFFEEHLAHVQQRLRSILPAK
jgi:GntR family transcriptional regulator, transcriptional repressor for pyruvate dehydrogenase complex